MADVYIRYSELTELDEQLKSIITELENCSQRADALESAIGNPYGKDRLRDNAEEFEDGWDDRRSALASDLKEVEQHVAAVVAGFGDWDQDAANKLDGAGAGGGSGGGGS